MEKPVLKFWSHDLNRPLVDKVHTHPYWQMEYIVRGGGTRVFDRNDAPVELKNGMFVLIPPLVPHRFARIGEGTETCSFKFTFAGGNPQGDILLYSGELPFFRWTGGEVERLIAAPLPVLERNRLLEYLLMNILDCTSAASPESENETPLLSRLRDLVHSRGRELNVCVAAEELNLTVSQLKYRFAGECAKAGLPDRSVKRYIDRLLTELIESYLEYSMLSIGEIARATRFPDIYSMSHFYKRLRGRSPANWDRRREPPV